MPSSALTLYGSGNLKPASSEGRDVGRLELEEEVAGRVAELGLRGLVDPGEGVDEEPARVVDLGGVRGVALVEL